VVSTVRLLTYRIIIVINIQPRAVSGYVNINVVLSRTMPTEVSCGYYKGSCPSFYGSSQYFPFTWMKFPSLFLESFHNSA